MNLHKFLLLGLLAASMVALNSCTPVVKLNSSLANEGMQGLSTEDPFFGPNILLAKEMERSNFLYSFIKEHGAPAAIELEKRSFKNHLMHLYYPKEGYVYLAEPETKKVDMQWIVRGPIKPHWKDQKRAEQIARKQQQLPVLYLFGRRVRFGNNQNYSSQQARVLQPKVPVKRRPKKPTAKKKAKPKVKKEATTETSKAPDNQVTTKASTKPAKKPTPQPSKKVVGEKKPAGYKPLNTDQQAILMSQGFAERAPNGDIVHKVVSPDESLALIALWYTGKIFHAKELATANRLSIDEPLLEGERIQIPVKLIKQYKVMPQDFVFSDDYQKAYGPKTKP